MQKSQLWYPQLALSPLPASGAGWSLPMGFTMQGWVGQTWRWEILQGAQEAGR